MTEYSDDFVRAVAEGIREFNRSAPPSGYVIRFDSKGKQVPPTPSEKKTLDSSWLEAVRFGLKRAEPFLILDKPFPGEQR